MTTHRQEPEQTRDINEVFREGRENLDTIVDQVEIVIEDTTESSHPPSTKARLVFTRKGVTIFFNGFIKYRKRYLLVLLPLISGAGHLVVQQYEQIMAWIK